ncbi:2-oxo-4-hydroxy-4-carboxy-5-ureidoimidazoline decarboxylase [Streptomyces europaeiscabiei]|uniref:2-oxo-4-hydroxy-4-carboxy-5-ureidoimidazoline decarboxylase n=1 Tax=Streptomyces europaeiscabiei TaxID=146819 RepID=A0ABU4NFJ1_9ACTN|nr:2-oxo-4-hydroxy-4-carboxy-5-ureidoimidazoline decarboxylase [Streptomyces europaeiscabiei]MDX3543077.1 2-oxo-4-hydroxy-4-carboxy-5-ureidoimidazoline decarboxylase [Streptomyces europaeiscabiei]MDX3552893.1 2-oxo-4-hydroxy-4-carboxy-5-ureidoimidazoline decarboxylase [Streptomyces europaeiscabiei]MDX3700663.1 2-oxo-4-hydroxy-4-carboxy-5-ureidoimidazoline decarboxylase [Streptomyces europaeiscabiei]
MTRLDNVVAHFAQPAQPPQSTPTHRRGTTLPPHRLPHLPGQVAIPEQVRTPGPSALERFNHAPAEVARQALLTCLRSLRWAHRLTDHRPYPDVDALLAASDEAAYDLTAADLAEALAGETLPTLPDDIYGVAHTALNAAHAAYEARFGHVFVISRAGDRPDELLDRTLEGLRSRLANDPEEERVVVAEELRRLARERLVTHVTGPKSRL